jgi:hypothetical protein
MKDLTELEEQIVEALERFDIDPYQEGGKYSPDGVMEKYNLLGLLFETLTSKVEKEYKLKHTCTSDENGNGICGCRTYEEVTPKQSKEQKNG